MTLATRSMIIHPLTFTALGVGAITQLFPMWFTTNMDTTLSQLAAVDKESMEKGWAM